MYRKYKDLSDDYNHHEFLANLVNKKTWLESAELGSNNCQG